MVWAGRGGALEMIGDTDDWCERAWQSMIMTHDLYLVALGRVHADVSVNVLLLVLVLVLVIVLMLVRVLRRLWCESEREGGRGRERERAC